jgi:hypothetical protein
LAALLKISHVAVVDVCVELILALGAVAVSVLFEASQLRPQLGEVIILVLCFKPQFPFAFASLPGTPPEKIPLSPECYLEVIPAHCLDREAAPMQIMDQFVPYVDCLP